MAVWASLSTAMKREPPSARELLQLKWLGGSFLYLLALWAVAGLDNVGASFVAFCAIVTGLFTLHPRLSARVPAWGWSLATAVLVAYVAVDFLMHMPDLITPLVRMITLLGLLRAVQPRLRRADLQLVLLSLFMLVLTGVLTLSLLFAFQLMVFTPAAMLTLLVITLAEPVERQAAPRGLWDDHSWGRLSERLRRFMRWRAVFLYAGLYACMLVATAAIFFLLPRFRFDQALPFMRMPATRMLSGFSDTITFGDVTDIVKDDSVALRVDVPQGYQPASPPYWRMVALDEYTGEGFRVSNGARTGELYYSQSVLEVSEAQPAMSGPWTFYFEGGVSRYLPLPGRPSLLRFQNRQELEFNQNTMTLATRQIPGNVLFYQIEGLAETERVPASRIDRRALPRAARTTADLHADEHPYTTLALPRSEDDRRRLARVVREIGGDTLDAQSFSAAAALWLAQRHPYSLASTVPSGGGDKLLRWMFSAQPGHCELFAGAHVLLMRAAGHPARIVTGFSGGMWNGYERYFMVRNSDAHAWVEYFDGAGWRRADPTPGNATAGGPQLAWDPSVDRTFSAYLDSLRVLWYRRIVNFDDVQQEEMIAWARRYALSARLALRNWVIGAYLDLRDIVLRPWRLTQWTDTLRNSLLLLLAWALFRGTAMWLRRRRGCRDGEIRLDRRRVRAGRCLSRLMGLPPDDGTRAHLVAELQAIRYGPPELWPPQPASTFRNARRAARRWRAAGIKK